MEPITDAKMTPAIAAMAAAFYDDPLMDVMAPDPERRLKVGPWFFNIGLKYGRRWGHVWCNEDASAVAAWLPPDEASMSLGRLIRCGFGSAPFTLGPRGLIRMISALSVAEKFHKQVKGPHWYLFGIGTHPDWQGQGFGSALVKIGTSRADEANLACYLETMTESNVEFYGKHGFEVIGEAPAGEHTIYGMVRPPQG